MVKGLVEKVIGCDREGDWDVAERGTVNVGEEEWVWPNEDKETDCVGSGWLWELEVGLMLGEVRGYSWIEGENWCKVGSEDCD